MKKIGIIILGLVLSSCGDEMVKKHIQNDKNTEIRGVIVAPIGLPIRGVIVQPIGVPYPLPIETDEGTIIVMPPPIDIFDD